MVFETTHSGIAAFTSEARACSIAHFISVARVVTITAECELPSDFEDMPNLPDRLRGALGNALSVEDSAPREGWLARVPSLNELLFGAGVNRGRDTLSRPYSIHVDIIGSNLWIRFCLTGLAASFANVAEAALRRCLNDGVAIKLHSKHRVAIHCRHVSIAWSHGLQPPQMRHDMRIVHKTPMRIRNKNDLSFAQSAIVPAILRRTRDIALWNGCDVSEDCDRLSELAKFLAITDGRKLVPPWKRFSRSSGSFGQPKIGLTGNVMFTGDLLPFADSFAVASLFHAGSETAHGFGRVEFWAA